MIENIQEFALTTLARIFPRSRFLSFISIMLIISMIIHTFFYIKILVWIKAFIPDKQKRKKIIIIASLIVIYLLIPLFLRYYFRQNNIKNNVFQYIFLFYPSIFYQFIVLAYSFIMLFYLPIKYLYRIILLIMEKIEEKRMENLRFSEEWKTKLKKIGILLPIALIFIWIYGNIRFAYFQKITKPVYKSVSVSHSLNGLKILQVTDTHVGMYFRKRDMEKLVDIINTQNADIIAFTGDYIDNSVAYLSEFIEPLKKLKKPRYGIYFCLGNHDNYSGYEKIANSLKRIGINVLRNSHKIINVKNSRLAVVGLEDLSTGAEDVDMAFEGIRADFVMLLVHQPYRFANYAQKGVNLVLCGHTHGGQIVLWKWGKRAITPAAFASPYISGFYRIGNSTMYVNRGYGTAFLPLRINCDPEIAVITLKSK